ncbi:MAG: hypothetical protein PHY40_03060 [Patescibacteria group bacterium]|jgi:hypothetical protein|nr:hypothetical protein [Patescibacteria group bacterium]
MKVLKPIYFLLALFLSFYPLCSRGEMSAGDYYIYADSVNTGGVISGGDYGVRGTFNESPIGFTTSTSYETRGGYQPMELGMKVSASSLSLGTLSATAIKTASADAIVWSDAGTGYTLSIGGVSGTSIANVSDGIITIGSEEYGLSVSGVDRAFTNDRAIAERLILASSSEPVTNSKTTLTFKASISDTSVGGSYSQAIVLTVSGNF